MAPRSSGQAGYSLETASPHFEDGFRALLAAKRETQEDVESDVAAIIDRVRADGDSALIH